MKIATRIKPLDITGTLASAAFKSTSLEPDWTFTPLELILLLVEVSIPTTGFLSAEIA